MAAVDQAPDPERPLSQHDLSSALEAAAFSSLKTSGSREDKARLEAAAAPHAGAWLQAPATKAVGLHLSTVEFVAAASLRIGARLLAQEKWCPKCDQTLCRRASHAFRCRGGGDITVGHNSLRDETFFRCGAAGITAERETSGLLPSAMRRRPGHIVIRSCPGLGPVALDFAVTCPLQASVVSDAAQRPLAAAMSYEAHKFEDRQTANLCAAEGLKLMPMVAETLGGWGPSVQEVFRTIARATAERQSLDPSIATSQLYRSLGIKTTKIRRRTLIS